MKSASCLASRCIKPGTAVEVVLFWRAYVARTTAVSEYSQLAAVVAVVYMLDMYTNHVRDSAPTAEPPKIVCGEPEIV